MGSGITSLSHAQIELSDQVISDRALSARPDRTSWKVSDQRDLKLAVSMSSTFATNPRDRTRHGIMDLYGNVSEWTGTVKSENAVVLGKWWSEDILGTLVAPSQTPKETRSRSLGFRCAGSPSG